MHGSPLALWIKPKAQSSTGRSATLSKALTIFFMTVCFYVIIDCYDIENS